MPQPSASVRELYQLILSMKKEPDLKNLLEDILTPQELLSIAERFQIIKALHAGKTQRRIAAELKTSIGKVTRGSRIIQFGKTPWSKIC